MKSYRPDWLKNEIEAYKHKRLSTDNLEARMSLTRCAGIRRLFVSGWVVKTWQDIHLEVHDDGSFFWSTPLDQNDLRLGAINSSYNYIASHPKSLFNTAKILNDTKIILKLQSPIFARIPKGYSMLQVGVPYQEQTNFTTAPGIFESSYGFFELNVQLFWHRSGKFVIEAGTPIAHLLLIKDEQTRVEFRDATEGDLKILRAQSILKGASKTGKHRVIKNAIAKLFKDKYREGGA
jgi:dUTPase